MASDSADYKVGYGKPPVRSRFQPGQSGHRQGWPKVNLSEVDELLKALGVKVKLRDGRRLSKLQLGLEQLKIKSVHGDIAAGRLIAQVREGLKPVAAAEPIVVHIFECDVNA